MKNDVVSPLVKVLVYVLTIGFIVAFSYGCQPFSMRSGNFETPFFKSQDLELSGSHSAPHLEGVENDEKKDR